MFAISEIVIAGIVFILAANVAFLLLLSRNYRRGSATSKVEPKVDADLAIPAQASFSLPPKTAAAAIQAPAGFHEGVLDAVRRFLEANGPNDAGKAMASFVRAIFLDQSAFTLGTLQLLPEQAQRDALNLLDGYLNGKLSFDELEALHDFAQICSGAVQPDSLASDI